MRAVLLGRPGSGKGTQGVRIADALGIPAVSTGDVFRANVKEGTELGLKVKAIIDAGDLVPDTLTGEIVRDRLAQADAANGFLLDGYPRNLGQVGDLDGFLDERGDTARLRPWVEALRAHHLGDRRALQNIAPEIRIAAEIFFDGIESRLKKLPDKTRRRPLPKTKTPRLRSRTRKRSESG